MPDVCVAITPFTPDSEPGMYIPTPSARVDPHKLACQQNIAGLAIATVVLICILTLGHVFEAPFSITNPDIMYQMRTEIVSYWWVLAAGFVIPPAVICGFTIMEKLSKFQIVSRISYYLFGLAITVVITEFLKLSVGRLRPDFLDRCKPDPLTLICAGNPKTVEDGRKSFPSGHSSTAIYIGMFMIFWIWRIPKSGKIFRRSPVVMMIFVGIFCASAYVAISRLQQNVHHPTDVLGGSLIGLVIAYFLVDNEATESR